MPSPSPTDLVASIDHLVLTLQRTYLARASPPRSWSRRRRQLDHLSRLLIRVQRLTTTTTTSGTQQTWDCIRLSTLLQLVDQDFLEHESSAAIGPRSVDLNLNLNDEHHPSVPPLNQPLAGTARALRKRLGQVVQDVHQHIQHSSIVTRKRRRPRDSHDDSHDDDDDEHARPSRTTPGTVLPLRERLDQAHALHLAVHDPVKLEQHRKVGPLPPPQHEQGFEQQGTEPLLSTTSQILSRLPPQWTGTTLLLLRSHPEEAIDELKSLLWTHAHPLIPSRLAQAQLKPLLRHQFLTPTPRPFNYAEFKATTLHLLFELLGQLCSPARDGQVKALLDHLDSSAKVEDVVDLVLDGLVMMDQMRLDLGFATKMAQRQLGTENAGRRAMERERSVVREIVGRKGWGSVEEETRKWVRERGPAEMVGSTMEQRFQRAFLEAVFDTRAVACVEIELISTTTPTEEAPLNRLPLTLLIPAPRIFTLQNQLQALVIVACLNSIFNSHVGSGPREEERSVMTRRLWALLGGIVDPDSNNAGETRLVNLVDELMRAHRRNAGQDGQNETKDQNVEEGLRRRVESVLRYEDPVFRLFSKRLKEGIGKELERTSESSSASASASGMGQTVPRELKTGRQVLNSSPGGSASTPSTKFAPVSIKGFEDLQEPLGQVLHQLQGLLEWVQKVWGEELGWNTTQGSQVSLSFRT